ncbi:hypothetical protein F5Y13DRAFT_196782 [Hypoxylon sp. FL1857]|nr:hypothetical protein F5Y13DRAFT_196782 [Hypoxylon sp. FL1857]
MSETTEKLDKVQACVEQIINFLSPECDPGQHFSAFQRRRQNLTEQEKKQNDYERAFQAWFNNVNIEQVESTFSSCIQNGVEPVEEEEEEDPDPFPKDSAQEWVRNMYNQLSADPAIARMFGVIISSSKKHDVDASEIQDHLDMPAYPDTNPGGIVHFIKANPRSYPQEMKSKDEKIRQKGFQKLAANIMSKISSKEALKPVRFKYYRTWKISNDEPQTKDLTISVKRTTSGTFAPESIIYDRINIEKLGLLHQEDLENEKKKTSADKLRDRTLARELIEALQAHEILGLTAGRFQTEPGYYRLCRKFGVDSLRGIHWALNIECTINAIIRAERLLRYPAGTALAGVQREFELDSKRPEDERWIREICYLGVKKDISRYFVICMTKKQAEAFRDCAHIQMDLSFKMVHGQTNLYSVVGLNEITNGIEVFAYVFLNWETTESYYQLFCRMFHWLGVVSGTPVRFKHIQGVQPGQAGTPVSTATLDMCKKQAHGLGRYLGDLDPSKSWQEHLQHVVIFCKVHLRRGFQSKFPGCDLGVFLDQIFGSPSRARLVEIINAATRLYPKTANWWANKLPDWLQGGLCQACSKIDPVDWSNALKHTGINESEHFMVNNFTGRSISLLMAVKLLYKFISNREERFMLFKQLGVHHKQKNMSTEAYFIRRMKDWNENYRKQAERREQNPSLSFNPSNPFDSTDIVPDDFEMDSRPLLGLDDLLRQAGNENLVNRSTDITQAENELRALSDQWMGTQQPVSSIRLRGQRTSSAVQDQSISVSLPEPQLPEYPRHMIQVAWDDHSESDPQLSSQDVRSSSPPPRRIIQPSQGSSGQETVITHPKTVSHLNQRKRGRSEVSITFEGISEAQLEEKEQRIAELRRRVAERRAQINREAKARILDEEERELRQELERI